MKRILAASFTLVMLIAFHPVFAQTKLTVNDKAEFLTESVELLLRERLSVVSVDLTNLIDNRRRCDYWFATIVKSGNDLLLSVADCNDKSAGNKNLGSVIFSATDAEKALLLYFAVSEVIKNPYGNVVPVTVSQLPSSPGELPTRGDTIFQSDQGQHRSRYLFAPSSYNLEKGELYYNTLYFLVHDVQYGISDQFSLGMGTTIIGFPFYVTPKLTLPAGPKSAFALGDMLIIGTWGAQFTGNLAYATYTRGNTYNNFTFGIGYLVVGGKEISDKINAPVFNFSALARVSSHIYFITETYASFVKVNQTGYYNNYDTGEYYEEEFEQNNYLMYSFFGFRFINKNIDVKCWQVGLSFVIAAYGEIPAKYQNSSTYYSTEANTGNHVIPIPMVGYARKFSTRY